jgi:hypothetical protein
MKRLLAALFVIFIPAAAFAFDTTRRADRIGVLLSAADFDHESETVVEREVRRALLEELRERGFDAFDSGRTFDEAARDGELAADYLVEIVGGDPQSDEYGGLGIGGRHIDFTVGMIVSRVAADIRIYDAETMELLATETLSRRRSAVVPTSLGFGGNHVFAVVALPFFYRAQYRNVARAAASDAATLVTATIRGR